VDPGFGEALGFLRLFLCTGFGVAGGALLRLLEPIAFPGKREDLGLVHEPIDQGDDTAGVGEDLIPFAEGFIGREDYGALLVAPGDDLEEQVRVA